jgi:hypothetical protein
MAEPIDAEITQLIGKLTRIQEEVGTIGGATKKSKKGGAGSDRFVDLRISMVDKLVVLRESVETAQGLEKQPGSNPRELIAVQSQIRGDLATLNEDWKELDALFRSEAKKRKSKISPEEMGKREKILLEFQSEIQGACATVSQYTHI